MNKIQKVDAVRKAIDTFDDAEFLSIISENEVAVRNIQTGSSWVAKYFFENDEVFFNTTESELIEEGTNKEDDKTSKRENFVESLVNLFRADSGVFSEDEEGLSELRSVVNDYSFTPKQTIVAQAKKEESLRSLLEEESTEVIDSIANKYDEKISAFNESKNDFLKFGRLFNEDEIISSEKIVNPITVINIYHQKQKLKDIISEGAEVITSFYADIKEKIGEDQAKLLNEIHLEDKENAAVAITKILIKNGFKAADTRVAIGAYNESYNTHIEDNKQLFEEMHGLNKSLPLNAVGDEKGTRFLKFGQGIFGRNDVIELLEDFDRVIASIPTSHAGAFQEIIGMRNVIDTMLVTNTIDDEVIVGVIDTFNKRFANVERGTPIPSAGNGKNVPSYTGVPGSN